MTLPHALLLLAFVAASVLAFLGYARFAEMEIKRLTAYEYWSDQFFNLTKKSLKTEIPKDWLELLEGINTCIANKNAAMGLYMVYSRRLVEAKKSARAIGQEEVLFVSQKPESTELFLKACQAGFMAMTYTHPIWGVKARSAMAEYLASDEQPVQRVSEMETIGRAFRDFRHASHKLVPA
ncbi:hypothetical protein DNX69_02015 [Rhodopseudomonas palustris]|uniref:DUF4760 domain-containing protein n=1 Tax=Rhodopseudomonas palustris TaxID=1076 RepID=A0A323ULD8_RHOPL|nr:hypothetical protein [Rhodopseudomonas palustris]PZA13181.1 hypothetical protein DNX69_02015 [Rhodopseudomonas palustris]